MDRSAKLALFFSVATILCDPLGRPRRHRRAHRQKVTPRLQAALTTAQTLKVTIAVSQVPRARLPGRLSSPAAAYKSSATTLATGSAAITIPAGSLAAGTATLTAKYTPSSASSSTYAAASGTAAITVTIPTTAVAVKVDVLANRHVVSPFIYGGAFPNALTDVSDSGNSLVRWGGNSTSNYNWKLHTYNAGNDWYFEDFTFGGTDPDSVKFITDIHNAGSHALTTMPMLAWVAQSARKRLQRPLELLRRHLRQAMRNRLLERRRRRRRLRSDCSTPVTTAAVTKAYYPLLDTTGSSCPSGNCVFRGIAWAKALATAFGTASCPIPWKPPSPHAIFTTWITRWTSGAEAIATSIPSPPVMTNSPTSMKTRPPTSRSATPPPFASAPSPAAGGSIGTAPTSTTKPPMAERTTSPGGSMRSSG